MTTLLVIIIINIQTLNSLFIDTAAILRRAWFDVSTYKQKKTKEQYIQIQDQ